jgi:hypothetical protein
VFRDSRHSEQPKEVGQGAIHDPNVNVDSIVEERERKEKNGMRAERVASYMNNDSKGGH